MHPSPPVEVDAQALQGELDTLANFSDSPAPSVTRIVFTPTDMAARDYVKQLMREAGLTVREDAAGNIFARWQGSVDRAVATGSHCDAIPHAGKYDGTVGVLGAIAAIRALRNSGFTPQKSIDVIMFTSEEPTRFGIGCSGSRLMGGAIDPQTLEALSDAEGVTFAEARHAAGYTGELQTVELGTDTYDHFVELHIEQGPVLEHEQTNIGIVSAIAAPASLTIEFNGRGGHAGAVLMRDRQDALVPAAILVETAERLALDSASDDSVATVGMLDVHPSAVNSIPRKARLSLDIRDTQLEIRDSIVNHLVEKAQELAAARGLQCEIQHINSDPPVQADAQIMQAIHRAAESEGLSQLTLVSRAYHDALFIARKVPTGMIFVPSRDGISHRPDEYTSSAEIGAGVAVLARTLADLAGSSARERDSGGDSGGQR
ncbi:MAG: M20 family metallo-hydrolase [Pseudomonadota bacterium]